MKASLCIGIGCLSLLLSAMTFAGCGSCGSSSCSDDTGMIDYTSSCDCTDPGCSSYPPNDCLSANECCEAFGNIGAR